jgi:aminomethyltransferase folate-binding domain-containing protein
MAAVLDRAFVRASGPDAVAYLQSMVSNDVEAVAPGAGTYALLLTPKARVIADLEVFRVDEDLVLACPPQAATDVLETLVRARFRKKVALDPADYALVWGDGDGDGALAELETPAGVERLLAAAPGNGAASEADWELARIEAGMPRFGHEFDGSSMPAEAGRDARDQLHQGLLSRPGAGRAAALPRPCEPRCARRPLRRRPGVAGGGGRGRRRERGADHVGRRVAPLRPDRPRHPPPRGGRGRARRRRRRPAHGRPAAVRLGRHFSQSPTS